jgi:hypothetical protein
MPGQDQVGDGNRRLMKGLPGCRVRIRLNDGVEGLPEAAADALP